MLENETAEVFDVEHPSGAGGDAPFIIEHRREEYDGAGTFRPSACLVLTERVRTSGLWRALTPEDAKTLILLLTFVTPTAGAAPPCRSWQTPWAPLTARRKAAWTGS